MLAIDLPKGQVKLYDSIEHLPQDLNNEFHAYVAMDSDLGSTMQQFDDKWGQIYSLVAHAKTEQALQELRNWRHTYYHAISKISHASLAFGCLVFSIEDEEIYDYSEPALQITLDRLNEMGLTAGLVKEYLDIVKKNLIQNLEYTSPENSTMPVFTTP